MSPSSLTGLFAALVASSWRAGWLVVALVTAASINCESHAQESPIGTAVSPPTRQQTEALERLITRVTDQRKRADALAQQLQLFKKKNKWASFEQRKENANESLRKLQAEAQQSAILLQTAENRWNQIKDYRARGADLTTLPFVSENPLVAQLQQQLSAQKSAVAKLSETFRVGHPTMDAATHNAAQAQSRLNGAVNQICEQAEAEYETAQESHHLRLPKLERLKAEVHDLARIGFEHAQIERDFLVELQVLQNLIGPTGPSSREELGQLFVRVVGAVNNPGAVTLLKTHTPSTLDAIARAGGFAANADRTTVRLIRASWDGARSTTVLTEETISSGSGHGFLQTGDIVAVSQLAPPTPKTTHVFGAVKEPRRVELSAERKMTIIDAIILAGGPSGVANMKKVLLIRSDPTKKDPVVLSIDAEALLDGSTNPAPVPTLEPGDVVFVSERVF